MAKSTKKTPQEFKDANAQILASLDIETVYESFGVRVAAKAARQTGWLPVHAFGRDDRNPSAEINVGNGSARGRYRDFGDGNSGASVSLWDFATDIAKKYAKWTDARADFAKQTGVDIPTSADLRPLDQFKFTTPTPSFYHFACKNKPGITKEAMQRAGAYKTSWPRGIQRELQQDLVTFKCYGPELFNADAVGLHSMNGYGKQIRIQNKNDVSHVKTMQNGPPGIVNEWAVRNWHQAKTVWVVEGLSDMMAMQQLLGSRVEEVVITMGGVSYVPSGQLLKLFEDKHVRVCFDVDPPNAEGQCPGQVGSARWTAALADTAATVRNVRLPYDVTDKKKDLRDWINEGNTYEELHKLSDKYADMKGSEAKSQLAALAKTGTVTNFVAIKSEEGGTNVHAIGINEIAARTNALHEDWPRRLGSQLFTHEPGGDIRYLNSHSDLFAYYQLKGVNWNDKGNELVKKAEFYSHLKQTATEYKSIETVQHYPKQIPGSYYACEDVEVGNGQAMLQFLDFFNPASVEDYYLLQAMLMTMLWGGKPGARPCFLITTTDEAGKGGRGSGKTVTAQAIAEVGGGYFSVGRGENEDGIKRRLLTAEAMTKRVVLMDNIKTQCFSWAALEAMITASSISGHRNYHGETTRPNYLTWIMTLNGASLGTDLAQRAITIKVKKPTYSGTWVSDVADFLEAHRDAIRGDVKAMLLQPPQAVQNSIRWTDWVSEIVGRLDSAQAVHDVVKQRMIDNDVEGQQAMLLLNVLESMIERCGYGPKENVFISNDKMKYIYNTVNETHLDSRAASLKVKQEITEGRLPGVKSKRTKTSRGFIVYQDESSEDFRRDFDSLSKFVQVFDGEGWGDAF